jgi:hypothetical protein
MLSFTSPGWKCQILHPQGLPDAIAAAESSRYASLFQEYIRLALGIFVTKNKSKVVIASTGACRFMAFTLSCGYGGREISVAN